MRQVLKQFCGWGVADFLRFAIWAGLPNHGVRFRTYPPTFQNSPLFSALINIATLTLTYCDDRDYYTRLDYLINQAIA